MRRMRIKTSLTALVAGGCAVAFVASAVSFAQAPAPPGAPAVQQTPGAPGAAGGRGAGRAGGAQAGGRAGGGGARGPQTQVASVEDLMQMMAALPETAPARACHQLPVNDPARAALANCAADRQQQRRVLVLARAEGFVHSSIPLSARTVEALGQKTGAWTTVITYNHKDITAETLAQYDALFLASTTGQFLDDADDPAGSEARRKALMDFVRSGKGMAGVHAATDSYHPGGKPGWPDFNTAIGGFFKFHWNYPTLISLKIDDLDNPINAPFVTTNAQGQKQAANIQLIDEVYTFEQNSWSRDRVRTLTSINYERMPDNIKAQEPAAGKRTDGDYGISYIRKEGNGRVFVNVLGHSEQIYKMRNMNAHLLAGMQYVLGDLKVNDTPVPLQK